MAAGADSRPDPLEMNFDTFLPQSDEMEWVRNAQKKAYYGMKYYVYNFYAICFALPMSVMWGFAAASSQFAGLWMFNPGLKVTKIFMEPVFGFFSIAFSGIFGELIKSIKEGYSQYKAGGDNGGGNGGDAGNGDNTQQELQIVTSNGKEE